MEVILLEDHPHLGSKGSVVTVANGYARNYLIPKGIAVENSISNMKSFKAEEQFEKEGVVKEKEKAEELKKKLDGLRIVIEAKVGKDNKLYGSITNHDIAEKLEESGHIIDKRDVKMDEPIKETGTYDIEISLFEDIKTKISLLVEKAVD